MRIAVFIKHSSSSGGLETQNDLLVEGLEKKGHQVTVFETKHPRNDSEVLEEFRCQHRDTPFAVIISQSAAGTPVVRRKREFDLPVIVIQHGTLLGSVKTRLSMLSLIKRFYVLPRLLAYALKVYLFFDLPRLIKADAVIAVSNQVRDALIREYLLSPEKVNLVFNGIEVGRFAKASPGSVRENLGLTQETPFLLYLGRVASEKGIDRLITALASVRKVNLVVVGDGPEKDNLREQAKELGLGHRVQFVGQVDYSKVPQYYAAADIFVLPSVAWEGLPMTVIEAMAAGLPVIASRVGGVPDAVQEGKTGILVEPANVGQLKGAVSQLLQDNELQRKMGKSARELAKRKFSQAAMTQNTLAIIHKVKEKSG